MLTKKNDLLHFWPDVGNSCSLPCLRLWDVLWGGHGGKFWGMLIKAQCSVFFVTLQTSLLMCTFSGLGNCTFTTMLHQTTCPAGCCSTPVKDSSFMINFTVSLTTEAHQWTTRSSSAATPLYGLPAALSVCCQCWWSYNCQLVVEKPILLAFSPGFTERVDWLGTRMKGRKIERSVPIWQRYRISHLSLSFFVVGPEHLLHVVMSQNLNYMPNNFKPRFSRIFLLHLKFRLCSMTNCFFYFIG